MKISKSRLKAIIKEELGRSDGEFKCSELQSSWDEAYGEFQRAGGRKNADALQVWDSISTNLKKQAKQLVVSGQVGLCPLLTTDEFEMGRGELKSSGGKDVGFIPETEQLGLDLGDEPASEEGPDKYQSHYEGSKLVRGPGWEELRQKLEKAASIFPLATKIAKMLNSFGAFSTYKLHQLEKAVDRGDWDRLQALYDGEIEFGRKMSSGYYGRLDESMKTTKQRLKQIIKEEMAEAYKAPRDFGRKPVPWHRGTSTMMRDAPTPEERQQDLEKMLATFDEVVLQVRSMDIEDEESMKNARAAIDRVGRMIYDIQSHLDQSTYYQDDLDFAKEPEPYGDEQ